MQQRAPRPDHSIAVRLVPNRLADVAGLLDLSPIAAQLYDANGYSTWMNEANRALLGLPGIGYGVGNYNILTDPWSVANGYAEFYRRAYAGELVNLPAVVVNFADPANQWATTAGAKVLSQLLLPLPDETGSVRAVLAFTVDRTGVVATHAELASLHERLELRSLARTADLASALAQLEDAVTAHRQTEAALADRDALTQALFSNAAVGMALVDPDGRLLLVNDAFARFLDIEPAELAGLELDALIHPDDVDLDMASRAELLAGARRSYTVDQRFLGRSGLIVWGHLSVTLLRDGVGKPRLTVIVCEDITARIRADEERARLGRRLQEAQRLESMGILAGGVAHDFNNLLTSIQGNADLALLNLPAESVARPYLEQICQAVAQASELTRLMFAYAGRRHVVARLSEVNEAIGAMVDLLRASHARNCSVRFELSPGLPLVAVDAAQVRQIVMNLVVNAAEATGDGGEIVVSTTAGQFGRGDLDRMALGEQAAPGLFVRVTVSDSGCGMAPETLARIFDPFFTTKLLGRGLGLASVHTIVREHRGALWVQSEPGRGTAFHVLLPAAA